MGRLKGHTTSARLLPEGEFPLLDELRGEQLRLRSQVAADLDVLAALDARFKAEDEQHAERLRQAQRDGTPESVEDRRTPSEQRGAERAAIEERMRAGAQVFAEVADEVVATMREHEGQFLADLRVRLRPAQEKRKHAERLLAEARAEEFQLYKLGQWIKVTADDEAFGRQPAPTIQPVPRQFSSDALRGALERPWHKTKPWDGATTQVPA